MKKQIVFEIIFWFTCVVLLSLIFKSGCKSYAIAFLYGSMMLPALLMANFLYRKISFCQKMQGIKHTIYLTLAVLATAYFGFSICSWYLNKFTVGGTFMLNPILLLFIIASFCAINHLLKSRLFQECAEEEIPEIIEFISDRKKITLEIQGIKYIESCDSEVWVRCLNGESYRTKMNISKWEEFLSSGFIRVHRSFLVNKSVITHHETTQIFIGEETIPISRKYRK